MTTAIEYALLAGDSYISNRDPINQFPIPAGWQLYSTWPADSVTGFEASTYRNGTDVVISFAGTDFSQPGTDFLHGNIPLFFGIVSDQLKQAAEYYLQVKALNPNVTITGHSLGGGIAALIAVFFGETAFTFDQAPFAATAQMSSQGAVILKAYLLANGHTETELVGLSNFIAQQQAADGIPNSGLVTNYNVQGEIVSLGSFARIGNSASIPQGTPFNVFDVGFATDLHSQALLTGLLQSNLTAPQGQSLSDVTFKLHDLLKLIFDDKLYAFPVDKGDENFMDRLVRHEFGNAPGVTKSDMLTHFTSDAQKLGADTTNLSVDAQRAMIAQEIEWYYWQGAGYAGKEFFTQTGALLQYTTAMGDDLDNAKDRAGSYAQKWLTGVEQANGVVYHFILSSDFDQWNVATGAGVTATALNADKRQIFVGNTGADTFTGGKDDDLFFAGDGSDVLTGGKGDDKLYGGNGSDTYLFQTGDGDDTIVDSDGQGIIKIDGNALNGGKETTAGAGIWQSEDKLYQYVVFTASDGSKTLKIINVADDTVFGGIGNYLIGGAGNAANDADYVNSIERKAA